MSEIDPSPFLVKKEVAYVSFRFPSLERGYPHKDPGGTCIGAPGESADDVIRSIKKRWGDLVEIIECGL